VSCSGDACSGQDPLTTGCANDAYTATATNMGTFSLQERYSPRCATNWTRIVVYPVGNGCMRTAGLWAIQDTGYQQYSEMPTIYRDWSSHSYWTPMIYSPVHKVRGKAQTLYVPFAEEVYTPWACHEHHRPSGDPILPDGRYNFLQIINLKGIYL